ncbi:hypothetical protein [Sphingomonas sp. T9W2]|uniref:hypothetical protein n=1 Tax=Sphingomonas sp. T9W2 TaxID=3143183 RepID=UPI0031F5BFB8
MRIEKAIMEAAIPFNPGGRSKQSGRALGGSNGGKYPSIQEDLQIQATVLLKITCQL